MANPEFLHRVEKLKFLMFQNNPKAKITDSQLAKWANCVRLMVERDSRSLDDIDEIIEFSQRDDFWKTVILSMPKLREKFDQLTMKMKQQKGSRPSWMEKYKDD